MHESLREVRQRLGSRRLVTEFAGPGNLAWRKIEEEQFFSPMQDLQTACSKGSAFRVSLLETWKVDAHKAPRVFEERRVQVERGPMAKFEVFVAG